MSAEPNFSLICSQHVCKTDVNDLIHVLQNYFHIWHTNVPLKEDGSRMHDNQSVSCIVYRDQFHPQLIVAIFLGHNDPLMLYQAEKEKIVIFASLN